MRSAGVYIIRNKVTGESYIGQSTNVYARKAHHFAQLRKGKSPYPDFQISWDLHGEEAFEFELLERIEDKFERVEKEKHYILLKRPVFNILRGERLSYVRVSLETAKAVELIAELTGEPYFVIYERLSTNELFRLQEEQRREELEEANG